MNSDLIPFIDDPDDDLTYGAAEVTCKRCGATDLEWVDTGGKPARWRLYDGNKLHTCPSATADDFEDLTNA